MHKFPALNLNKNANETLWVLMMQRASSLLFVKKHEEMFHADSKTCFDASGFMTLHILLTF